MDNYEVSALAVRCERSTVSAMQNSRKICVQFLNSTNAASASAFELYGMSKT